MTIVLTARRLAVVLQRRDLAGVGVRRYLATGVPYPIPVHRVPGLTESVMARHWPGVPPQDMPAQMAKDPARVAAAFIGSPEPDVALGATVHDPQAAATGRSVGHQNYLFGRHEIPAHLQDLAAHISWPLIVFSAFPNGFKMLSDDLAEAYLAAPDPGRWLEENRAEIEEHHASAFAEAMAGRSQTGRYIILGSGAVIRVISHTQTVLPGGQVLTEWQAQTASRHPFDGAFSWGWKFDRSALEMTTYGLQVGRHPQWWLDWANAVVGGTLHNNINNAAIDFAERIAAGRPAAPGDYQVITSWERRMTNIFLAAGDYLSAFPRWLRGDGNTQSQKYEIVRIDGQVLERSKDGPDPSLETDPYPLAQRAGTTIDGEPVVSPAEASGFAQTVEVLPDGLRARVRELVEQTCTQSAWGALRQAVLAIAAEHLDDDMMMLPTEEMIQRLMFDPASRILVLDAIRSRLYEPIADQLAIEVNMVAAGDAMRADLLKALAVESFHETYSVPMLGVDGALRATIEAKSLEMRIQVLAPVELAQKLQRAQAAADHERARIEDLRAHPQDGPAQRAWEEALAEAERSREQADRELQDLHGRERAVTELEERRRDAEGRERESADRQFPE